MNTMQHDGYVATIEIDDETGDIHGRVVNTRAILTFVGTTVAELRQAFADTIDEYRAVCAARGMEPEKPYSGTLSLRIPPELHRRIAAAAARDEVSINQYIVDRLQQVA